ncbi:hypothetical protein BHE74_00035304 [Ensete ventricosum]|nr:hypothetical protein BHE74_00035304 [Ensete ventricosum]
MGGTYRSARLPVRGPPAIGRYRQKSTVGGRLREKLTVGGRLRKKKGRKERGKEEKRRGEEIIPRCPHPREEMERLPTRGERSRRLVNSSCNSYLLSCKLDECDNDSTAKNRREQSSRRSKEKPTFVEKHERSKEYDMFHEKHRSHCYDSGKDIYKVKDKDFLKKHQKYEENYYDDRESYKRKHREDPLGRKRVKPYVNEHMKSKEYKSRIQEQLKHAQFSDYTDDDRELSDGHSNSLSSDKSSHRLSIDEERYNGRSCSDDLGSDVDPSRRITSQHSGCLTESREYDRRSKHKSHDYEIDGHSSKFGKPNNHHLRVSSHDLDRKARSEGSDLEDADAHLPYSRSSREKKHDRSSRKRNLYQKKGEDDDSSDEPSTLESSNKKLKRKEEKIYPSRSSGRQTVR